MEIQSNLTPQFNTYDQQKCFIAYTHKAPWSEDIIVACTEVLPRFGLEPRYADDQFEPSRSLKEKVVEMIANARYGIFDLSAMYDNERKEWVMPRNVLIELGIAIALNRPVLLLRSKENCLRGCPLPACLTGIDDIIEFSGEPTLKRALEERIPQWMNVSPEQMWWTRACLFGGRICEYREVHPRMERWQQEGLHCHIADGSDADRVDFRCLVEDEMERYNDLTFAYLNDCKPTHPYHFVQCAHCQTVRSSQFALYRITPQTDAETYMAIGMSMALEVQFGYEIPKIFLTADVHEVPSLLSGYEVIEAVNTKARKQRLRKALPVVMQRVQECAWNPRVLPFEVVGLVAQSFSVREESGVVEEESEVANTRLVVFHEQLRRERQIRGWSRAYVAGCIGVDIQTVSRWEHGEALPQSRYHQDFVELFGKTVEELGLVDQQGSKEKEEKADTLIGATDQEEGRSESYSGLEIDPVQRRVRIDGKLLPKLLSAKQFKLLEFLAAHADKVCRYEETSRAVYGDKYISQYDDARLHALIERTRLHIGDDLRNPRFIETVRGVGHRLNGYIGKSSEELGLIDQHPNEEVNLETNGTTTTIEQERDVAAPSRHRVFIGYSQRDKKYFRELQAHLATYERENLLDVWDDTKIVAGTRWQEEIKRTLDLTKVAILLISADFLASSFIEENILPPLLQAAEAGGTIILLVIIGHCGFEDTSLQQFQPFNSPSEPLVNQHPNGRHKVWANLVRSIVNLMKGS